MFWNQIAAARWRPLLPPKWTIKAEIYNHGSNGIHRVIVMTDPTRWGHWRVQLLARPEHEGLSYIGDVWVDDHPGRIRHDRLYYPTPDACLQDGLVRLPGIVKAMHPYDRRERVPVILTAEQLQTTAEALAIAADWYGPTHTNPCASDECPADCRRAGAWLRLGTALRVHTATSQHQAMTFTYIDWLRTCDALDAACDWTLEELHVHDNSKQRTRCRTCRPLQRRIRAWRSVEDLLRKTVQGSPPALPATEQTGRIL